MSDSGGSIMAGVLVMFIVSLLLFWLPAIGPVIAGFAGGRKAGGFMNAIAAALLPSIAVGVAIFVFSGALAGVPVLGAILGMGTTVVALLHVGPLLLGAIIGGVTA